MWVCRARHACRVVAVGVLHPVTPCRITVHVCKRVDGVQTIHLGKLDKNADTSNAGPLLMISHTKFRDEGIYL